MVTRIWMIVGWLMFVAPCISASEMVLDIVNREGVSLEEVVAGVPFIISCAIPTQVTAQDCEKIVRSLYGPTIINSHCKRHTSFINHRKQQTTTVMITAQYEHAGEYYVGPVSIDIGGIIYSVPQKKIIVASHMPAQSSSASVVIDAPQLYQNQVTRGTLSCIHEPGATDFEISLPTGFEKYITIDIKHPHQTALANGLLKTSWSLYMHFSSQLSEHFIHNNRATMPPLGIKYQVADKQATSFFSLFQHNQFRTQHLYTNALEVKLLPLPAGVQHVGSFSDYTLITENTSIDTGKTCTIYVHLKGDAGSTLYLERPLLEIPQGLQVYEGTSKHFPGGTAVAWEYIVHALQPGDYTITAPPFTFLHPETGAIHTLTTEVVHMHITGAATAVHENKYILPPEEMPSVTPMLITVPMYGLYDVSMPSWLFWGILSVLFLSIVVYSFFRWVQSYRLIRYWRKKIYLRWIYGLLQYYAYRDNSDAFYRVLLHMISQALGYDETQLFDVLIDILARREILSHDDRKNLAQFMHDIAQESYSSSRRSVMSTFKHKRSQLYGYIKRIHVQSFMMIMLIFLGHVINAGEGACVSQQIQLMRKNQLHASAIGYWQLENAINTLVPARSFAVSIWLTYTHIVPPIIAELFFCFLCFLLAYAFIKKWFLSYKIFILIMLGLSFLTVYGYVYERAHARAIVASTNALRTGPDKAYEACGSVEEAQEVVIKTYQNSWCKIATAHQYGWIESDQLLSI